VLGFPGDETVTSSLASPFHRENRKVIIDPTVSTMFRHRSATAPEVARIIKEVAALRVGNYAAFFSSFAYLELVRPHLCDFGGNLIVQQKGMREQELEQTMSLLKNADASNLILAVQGGFLAEGVDYPGAVLVGAFIVGPGIPEPSLENELLRAHFESRYEAGFDYAYLFPGMTRVIQSAGRVIRSEDDAGFIMLIGRRFSTPRYSALIPQDWYQYSVEELMCADPVTAIGAFWKSLDP
jgi:DNA excision repair protein ERCC-2